MLQGSLDNFSLDEVLGLLSTTSKTGRLMLEGDRGNGTLSLHDGRLVAAETSYGSNGTSPDDVVFELLRYEAGEFSFQVVDVEPSADDREVADVLLAAEGRLADWRTIQAVVPSVQHFVTPVADLPTEEVKVNRAEWSTLIVIASGCAVSVVCDALKLGEVEGSRQIKHLAERGLVAVGSPGSAAFDVAGANGARGATTTNEPFVPGATFQGGQDAGSNAGAPIPPRPNADATPTIEPPSGPPVDAAGLKRPPMPAAPTAADLAESTSSSSDSGDDGKVKIGAPKAGAGESENGATNGDSDDGKAGGLLMRYLKNED